MFYSHMQIVFFAVSGPKMSEEKLFAFQSKIEIYASWQTTDGTIIN